MVRYVLKIRLSARSLHVPIVWTSLVCPRAVWSDPRSVIDPGIFVDVLKI